jgi:hypothetical protein
MSSVTDFLRKCLRRPVLLSSSGRNTSRRSESLERFRDQADWILYNFLVLAPAIICYVFVVFCRFVLFSTVLYHVFDLHFRVLRYGESVVRKAVASRCGES